MPGRRHEPEGIIGELREVETVPGQGGRTADACRRIAVSEQTCCRWRKGCGGRKTDQARRMEELEKENLRLRRAISGLTPDKPILQEAARGNVWTPRGDGGASTDRGVSGRCPNHGSAAFPASIDRCLAKCRVERTTSGSSPKASSRWPSSIVSTVIAR